jgi:hypothetical protein
MLFFYFYYIRIDRYGSIETRTFRNAIILRETLIQTLRFFPVVVIFVYVLAFSVLFTLRTFQTESFSYSTVALPAYVVLILCIIAIISSELLFIPRMQKDKVVYLYRSDLRKKAFEYAQELRDEGKPEQSLSVLGYYMKIEGNDEEINILYNDIVDILARKPGFEGLQQNQGLVFEGRKEQTLYDRGKTEFEKGNYYSALYDLEKARSLHRDNMEIQRLYARCKKKVDSLLGSLTTDEKKKQWLIQKKSKALRHLENEEYYEAHEIFLSLNKSFPELTDISLYLKNTEEELLKEDFLPEHMISYEWLPSKDNIIFIDRRGYINTVERTVRFNGDYYFYNIKRYKMERGKHRVYTSKYGKWMQGNIRLKNNEGFSEVDDKDKDIQFIYPYTHPIYLVYAQERDYFNIYEYFKISEDLYKSGFDIEDRYFYISRKLGVFFSVYVLSLFLSALAWAKRSIYEFPPVPKLVIFAVIAPVAAYFLYILYNDMNSIIIYSHRYFTRYVFHNFNVALYTGLINLAFSLAATFYFLSQSNRVE